MKALFYSQGSNKIFGDEADATHAGDVRVITKDEVPDLIANGATVDASADYVADSSDPLVGSVATGNVSSTGSISSSDTASGAALIGTDPSVLGAGSPSSELIAGAALLASDDAGTQDKVPETAQVLIVGGADASGSVTNTPTAVQSGITPGITLNTEATNGLQSNSAALDQQQLGAEQTGALDVHPESTLNADTSLPAIGDTGPNGVVWPAASAHASNTALSAASVSPGLSTAEVSDTASEDEKALSVVSRLRAHLWTYETSAVQHLHSDLDWLENLFKKRATTDDSETEQIS